MLTTALFGEVYIIVANGELAGGPNMVGAFASFGAWLGFTTLMMWHHARRGNIERHWPWAIHSYGQALGSFLYRYWNIMLGLYGYGYRHISPYNFNNGTLTCYSDGSCDAYLRPFDQLWAWGFWISTALLAQLIIIGLRRSGFNPGGKAAATGTAATLLDPAPSQAPSNAILNATGILLAAGTCLATTTFLHYFAQEAPLIWGRLQWWPKPNGCTTWPWCGGNRTV